MRNRLAERILRGLVIVVVAVAALVVLFAVFALFMIGLGVWGGA
jgi:hypothetical protein